MRKSEILSTLLKDLASQVDKLSDAELEAIRNGFSKIDLKITKIKRTKTASAALTDDEVKNLIVSMQKASSRDEAMAIIEPKTKKALEEIAKQLDISVLNSDKIDSVRSKLIEATVGAILRSKAIQGT